MAYRQDDAAFSRVVLNAAWMKNKMVTQAEAIKARAEALAAEHEVSGEFQRSFVIESGTHGARRPHARNDPEGRAWAQVRNTDPHAISIEAGHKSGPRGSANRQPVEGLHILKRALDAGSDE